MRVGVIGAGRLGLTFALLCAREGVHVIASDKNSDYINSINNKTLTSNEPEIVSMLSYCNTLHATVNNADVVNDSDIIFIFVNTPSLPDGSYDTSNLMKVVDEINEMKVKEKTIVVGCTVNPGDCEIIQSILLDNFVIYNPEFIAQGSIAKDLRRADMVLIGSDKPIDNSIFNVYSLIQTTYPKFNVMSLRAAEICKIAINCFLTTKISYANMIGEIMVSSGLEQEIPSILAAIGDDTRIGHKYLKYGYGFGGPCLPRDNRALGHYARGLGINVNIALTTDDFNNSHAEFLKNYLISKNHRGIPFYTSTVAYKRGTDIITESQQLRLVEMLLDDGHSVYIDDTESIRLKIDQLWGDRYDTRLRFSKFDKIKEEVFIIDI